MDNESEWATLLVDTIRRTHNLSQWYWELLVEFAVLWSHLLKLDPVHTLLIITSLTEAKEWSKLECWIGIIWMVFPREANSMAEGDLGNSILLLFRQRPGAVQKLEQWMERWSHQGFKKIPEAFKHICEQVHGAAQQDAP